MPTKVNEKLLSWASEIDDETIRQAQKTSRLPIVEGHVALMPDAHVGIGATIGSVIPTKGAVIPSAVGVDIGCGMIAAELDVTQDQLPDSLEPLLGRIER
ncbi:MAG: RtcB family protein, partial [Acidimicrobiales bacterium]